MISLDFIGCDKNIIEFMKPEDEYWNFVSFTQEDEYLFRLRQNHGEVEVISFLVFFIIYYFLGFGSIPYPQIFFIIFKCCGLYNDF